MSGTYRTEPTINDSSLVGLRSRIVKFEYRHHTTRIRDSNKYDCIESTPYKTRLQKREIIILNLTQ